MRKGRPIRRGEPGGLNPHTPEAVLAKRIDAAHMVLVKGGHAQDAFVIKSFYRKARWRMLVEYLEFMTMNGYPEDIVELIRDWRPDLHAHLLDLGVLD